MEITTAVNSEAQCPELPVEDKSQPWSFSQPPANEHKFKAEPMWQSSVTVTLARERGPGVGLCW